MKIIIWAVKPPIQDSRKKEVVMEMENEMLFSQNTARVLKSEKRKKNTIWKQKVTVTVFLLLFMCIAVLLTPVFNVERITVTGNSFIPTEKILEVTPSKTNKNIFLFSIRDAERKLSELSFVDEVSVRRIFPSEVSIAIKECQPVAQIMCGQSLYLVTDKNGKILDTAGASEKYGVPVISRMEVAEFEVGKKVVSENSEDLKKTLLLLEELSNNNMLSCSKNVYIKGRELHANFDGDIDCNFGEADNLSYRVKFVKECLQKIPEGQSGEIRFMEDYKAVFTKTN